MATVLFVREGCDSDRASEIADITSDDITKLQAFHKICSETMPYFNKELGDRPFSARKYVVVKIESTETNQMFIKPGYYLIKELTCENCRHLLNLKDRQTNANFC